MFLIERGPRGRYALPDFPFKDRSREAGKEARLNMRDDYALPRVRPGVSSWWGLGAPRS